MIVAYVGTPGSYKTHDASKQMIRFMQDSKIKSRPDPKKPDAQPGALRHVYTNVRGFGQFEYREILKAITGWTEEDCLEYLHPLTDQEMIDHFGTIGRDGEDKGRVVGCKFQRNAVICIDEVHTLFNSRDYQSDSNRAFTYYGTYHRHENSNVLLITHDIEKVDKQIRDLVGITYVFEQVMFFGSKGKSKYNRHMYRGVDTIGKAVHREMFSIDMCVINSYMTTKSGDVDNFEFVKTPNVLLKSPAIMAIPVVLVISLFLLYKASSGNGLIGHAVHGGAKGAVAASSSLKHVQGVNTSSRLPHVAPVPMVAFKPISTARMVQGRQSSASVAVAGKRPITGRVVGVVNIGGKWWSVTDDGLIERGGLRRHPEMKITGVHNEDEDIIALNSPTRTGAVVRRKQLGTESGFLGRFGAGKKSAGLNEKS